MEKGKRVKNFWKREKRKKRKKGKKERRKEERKEREKIHESTSRPSNGGHIPTQ